MEQDDQLQELLREILVGVRPGDPCGPFFQEAVDLMPSSIVSATICSIAANQWDACLETDPVVIAEE
jgi:hypothetical protein